MSANNQTDHFYNFNSYPHTYLTNHHHSHLQTNSPHLAQLQTRTNSYNTSSSFFLDNTNLYTSTEDKITESTKKENRDEDEYDSKSAKRLKTMTNLDTTTNTTKNFIYPTTKPGYYTDTSSADTSQQQQQQAYTMYSFQNQNNNFAFTTNQNHSDNYLTLKSPGASVLLDEKNLNTDLDSGVLIKKSKRDPIAEYDMELAESIEYELGLKKQNGPRKNSWGNLSYAELITRAIESSAEQRLTLSQIYDWIIKYVPYFKEKFDRTSSAGWKNSIRHNLSLHNRFIRVQNESSGKSSWWMINPDVSKYSLNPSSSSCTSTSSSSSSSSSSCTSTVSSSINPKSPNTADTDCLTNLVVLSDQQTEQKNEHLDLLDNKPNKKYRRLNSSSNELPNYEDSLTTKSKTPNSKSNNNNQLKCGKNKNSKILNKSSTKQQSQLEDSNENPVSHVNTLLIDSPISTTASSSSPPASSFCSQQQQTYQTTSILRNALQKQTTNQLLLSNTPPTPTATPTLTQTVNSSSSYTNTYNYTPTTTTYTPVVDYYNSNGLTNTQYSAYNPQGVYEYTNTYNNTTSGQYGNKAKMQQTFMMPSNVYTQQQQFNNNNNNNQLYYSNQQQFSTTQRMSTSTGGSLSSPCSSSSSSSSSSYDLKTKQPSTSQINTNNIEEIGFNELLNSNNNQTQQTQQTNNNDQIQVVNTNGGNNFAMYTQASAGVCFYN